MLRYLAENIAMDIREQVKAIISKRCDVSSLKEEDELSKLGLDSLDLVEAMLEIEEALNIEFDSAEIEEAKTLKDIIVLIEKKLK